MDNYKEVMQRLKKNATEASIANSQDCWFRYPTKNKAKYNECSKNAAIPFHVFYEGKRMLKSLKAGNLEKCKNLVEPKKLQTCRIGAYGDLNVHLQSLENWIEREKSNFNVDKYT